MHHSGDYGLAKAGKIPEASVGAMVASPENIPHSSPSLMPQTLPANISGVPAPVHTSSASPVPTMSLASPSLASSPIKESRLASQFQADLDSPQSGSVTKGETGQIS